MRKVDGRRLQRLRTLRKAVEWEIQLETGQVSSRAEIAKREGISRAAVTQTLRLIGAAVGPAAGKSTSTAASREFETSGSFERALDRAALVSEKVDGRGYRELRKEVLRRFESEYLPRVLLDAENNISTAASIAGIDRKHLWRLLKRNGY
jgi:DNA-binding NtrC family response regulator